ncbi:MAG: D-alanyl-D-alanine dipeptidase [Acidimicrobiaceae bacterium]|nr:MAG: D-alanyl-D-alanine dipeptidase [Acidimicrobiaceae bacterium]
MSEPAPRIGRPRIGWPRLGTSTELAVRMAGVALGGQAPLPRLHEPEQQHVASPSSEPMVQLDHPRLNIWPHYSLGGWQDSISECWVRAQVAERLGRVCDALPDGFGLGIYDGWRPRALQARLYAAACADPALPAGLFAEPTVDPLSPAPHETGGAVDLTLTVGGVPVAIGTDFDDATALARTASLEDVPGPDREARRLLYWAMHEAGFVVFVDEWWHFELGTRRWAAITGATPVYGATVPPGFGSCEDRTMDLDRS